MDWHLVEGFQIIQAERCFLHKRSKDGSFIKLGYHVDDNLIVGVGWVCYQEYLARIKTKFYFKEEALNEHLGVIYRSDMDLGTCHMSQSDDHVLKFMKLFGHEDCTATPYPNLDGPEPCAKDCEVKYKGTCI